MRAFAVVLSSVAVVFAALHARAGGELPFQPGDKQYEDFQGKIEDPNKENFPFETSEDGGQLIKVEPLFHKGKANDDEIKLKEDTSVRFDVLANDEVFKPWTLVRVNVIDPPDFGTLSRPGSPGATEDGGNFEYAPKKDYEGADSFDYEIELKQPSGKQGTLRARVKLEIERVQDVPVAGIDTYMTDEDTPIRIGDFLSNDSDADTLYNFEEVIKHLPGGEAPTNGTVVYDADTKSYTYTPNPNFNGSDSFEYTITDGIEQVKGWIIIDILSVPEDPRPQDDPVTLLEDASATIAVLANDSDPDGDILTVTIAVQPQHGSAVLNADDTITYTPSQDYNGPDEIAYTVKDPSGREASAFVALTVQPVNDPPAAGADAATTPQGEEVIVSPLGNDSDVDGDALTISAIATPPAHGSVAIGDPYLTYTPDATFIGTDTFQYTISDGNGGTATADVTITVTAPEGGGGGTIPPPGDGSAGGGGGGAPNIPPSAGNDSASTPRNTAVTIDVRDNDTDVDGDAFSVTAVGQPANGQAALGADQKVTYTPNAGFHGTDTFTYTLTDGRGAEGTGTVTVLVSDPPIAGDDTATTERDVSATIDVLANDSDPEGGVLQVAAIIDPDHGTASLTTDLTIFYMPDAGFVGTDVFAYSVMDPDGAAASGKVTVTVNEPPPPAGCDYDPRRCRLEDSDYDDNLTEFFTSGCCDTPDSEACLAISAKVTSCYCLPPAGECYSRPPPPDEPPGG